MKMNSAQIEQTLQQFQAQPIPMEHPVMPQLRRLFGDHTYFLGGRRAVVVSLADWDDRAKKNGLEPHLPEVTELVVELEVEGR